LTKFPLLILRRGFPALAGRGGDKNIINIFAIQNTTTKINWRVPMKKLHVLWTTGERDVAIRMIFVYLMSAKSMGWWDEIELIIWGPSAKLVAEDRLIQKELDYLLQSGIETVACQGCTDAYGVTEKILELGIPVRFMGESLTEILKGEDKLITF
jgi:hypothetical protein